MASASRCAGGSPASGATVVVVYVDGERAAALARDIGGESWLIDLSDTDGALRVMHKASLSVSLKGR